MANHFPQWQIIDNRVPAHLSLLFARSLELLTLMHLFIVSLLHGMCCCLCCCLCLEPWVLNIQLRVMSNSNGVDDMLMDLNYGSWIGLNSNAVSWFPNEVELSSSEVYAGWICVDVSSIFMRQWKSHNRPID